MDLNSLIEQKKMTKYRLSQVSGVPKTTVLDICSGKSAIEKCNAKTILQLSKALGCSMEELMMLDETGDYDDKTGLPKDKNYFERGLPEYVRISLENMKNSWEIEDCGGKDLHWDIWWCELNADINSAEVDGIISSEQAWYLRKKYLRMERC